MLSPKIYYAHCMADYGTNLERQDIARLKKLGFKVTNPNSSKHKKVVKSMRRDRKTSSQIMDYFCRVVRRHDALAFRALPDGSLPAGVAKEIRVMKEKGGVIIELPHLNDRKTLTVDETRAYIRKHK